MSISSASKWHLQLTKDTLLVIPCSGDKKSGDGPGSARSILSALNGNHAGALAVARAALRQKAKVDGTLMSACRRYSGELYRRAYASIGRAVASGKPVLIVSGGYGLLAANEPIGWYNRRFALSDWPSGLLEECILDYAHHEQIRSVIGVMATTTDYAKLVRRVPWRKASLEATLVSPVFAGGCAQTLIPRAQGEAIDHLLVHNSIDQTWRSLDKLSLRIENL